MRYNNDRGKEMKRKIKVIDKVSNKVVEGEVELRNDMHFEVQKKHKAQVFKPKKGKGSFRRNKKVDDE